MVNLGKPSRGCQTCKTRRIKCDLTRPACQRCVNSGRRCPGVPTENDLLFRNETQITAQRSKGVKKSPVSQPPRSADTPPSDYSRSSTSTPPSETYQSSSESSTELVRSDHGNFALDIPQRLFDLNLSKESIAVSFYFRHFVPESTSATKWKKPYIETLRTLYPASSAFSPISEMTAALSMAAISNYPNMQHFRPDADAKYTQALRMVNAAILDPEQATKDETLMCVMLMGFYEVMSPTDRSLKNYENHMRGAVALVRNRGRQQFDNEVSLKLYRAVRSNYINDCIQKSESIETSPEGNFWLSDMDLTQNFITRLSFQAIGIPAIRQRANELMSGDKVPLDEELHSLIADARKIDAQLTQWYHNLPSDWGYESIPYLAEIPEDVEQARFWPGQLHSYPDRFIAYVYDQYRCHRIYVQGVISRCLANLGSGPNAQRSTLYQATLYITRKLVDDICAGVPFQMGYGPGCDLEIDNETAKKAAEATGSFLSLRPLFIASSVECISEEQRRWIKGRLRAIADGYGFHQARQLSKAPAVLWTGKRAFT